MLVALTRLSMASMAFGVSQFEQRIMEPLIGLMKFGRKAILGSHIGRNFYPIVQHPDLDVLDPEMNRSLRCMR